MKLDILVLASHPDDAELSCGGTIISHIKKGYKVGVVDFTRGEMGTRGTPEIRLQEAEAAGEILGLAVRENLMIEDIYFENNRENQHKIIKVVRKYRPDIVIANAVSDRHPDHGKGAKLAIDGCFMAGLKKIATELDGAPQQAWRPKAMYHYIQNNYIEPDIVIDISDFWDQKIKAIKAYKSQFYNPEVKEENTHISTPDFLPFIESRAREMGHAIGRTYGEGFTTSRLIGAKNLFELI